MASEQPHATMCEEIEPSHPVDQEVTLVKARTQSDYATFVAWARNEARKRCERGYCPKGKCRGHVEIVKWELVNESGDEFTCRYSADIYCRCQ